jgi:hypothetical protein
MEMVTPSYKSGGGVTITPMYGTSSPCVVTHHQPVVFEARVGLSEKSMAEYFLFGIWGDTQISGPLAEIVHLGSNLFSCFENSTIRKGFIHKM